VSRKVAATLEMSFGQSETFEPPADHRDVLCFSRV
jgi:hypothetical protein